MPRSRSAEISLWAGEERVRVEAKPRGWRGKWWLSWLPYRAGDEFSADVKVTAITLSGTRRLAMSWVLLDPSETKNNVLFSEAFAMPFADSTGSVFLGKSGEYVLGVDLITAGSASQDSGFNRRVMTFSAVSTDHLVSTVVVSLITATFVFIVGTVLKGIF